MSSVKYRDNYFSFKTNFEKRRFVVTQIAYEKGWTIKAKLSDGTKKTITPYIAQGGFVGFLSETGDTSYEMEFYTPMLQEGTYISIGGTFIFISTLIAYLYLDDRKRNKNKEMLSVL